MSENIIKLKNNVLLIISMSIICLNLELYSLSYVYNLKSETGILEPQNYIKNGIDSESVRLINFEIMNKSGKSIVLELSGARSAGKTPTYIIKDKYTLGGYYPTQDLGMNGTSIRISDMNGRNSSCWSIPEAKKGSKARIFLTIDKASVRPQTGRLSGLSALTNSGLDKTNIVKTVVKNSNCPTRL
jgi:hypothetical protein